MNTRTISKVAVIALSIYAVVNVIFIIASVLQYRLIDNYSKGLISDDDFMPLATTSDAQIGIAAVLLLVSLFACFCIVGRWIYQACKMNHKAGIQGLHYTPGWSVGWLFVPIATYFKPAMAMAEIYRASFAASDQFWADRSLSAFFPFWWGTWVVSTLLGNVSLQMSMRMNEFNNDYMSELLTISQIDMGTSALDIVCSLCLIKLIRTIAKNQESLEAMIDSSVFD